MQLQIKKLLDNADRVLGRLDGMSNGARVTVDLPVIAALKGLVAEEMYLLICDAAFFLGLIFEVLEAVGLVPACGEDVE